MARKHKHEEHTNHEAWAIPYGDLITLLLAFFVVMYAVSSVNEGKYRVLADSLSAALGGPPRSLKPVQIGDKPEKGVQNESLFNTVAVRGFEAERKGSRPDGSGARRSGDEPLPGGEHGPRSASSQPAALRGRDDLKRMADEVQRAMQDLIAQDLVIIRRSEQWLEVEINTDILFASGVAAVDVAARPVLQRLAAILAPFSNALRIEGHTDDRPIATNVFPSNWELSAARAASVVHLFTQHGIDPRRMTVVGLGEHHPVADNATPQGRNRNRRVVIVVLGEGVDADERLPEAIENSDGGSPVSVPALAETTP
ncbi:flagellar motor protein MotD [Sinimarinibacterium thermocellulolyticum]|uniref:Flagellar motor protein MotD n=1 Tax=Sinimarinibacterium thermocellulolyticum TaxID=3170016 RepID=A0ABV2ABF4_9GAMM